MQHFYTSISKHWHRYVEDSMDIKEIWVQYYELLETSDIPIDTEMQNNECQLLNTVSEGTGKIHFAFFDCKMEDVFKNEHLKGLLSPVSNSTHQDITYSVEPYLIVCYQHNIPAVSNLLKQKRSTKYCLLVVDEDGDDVDSGVTVLSEPFAWNCIVERCDTSEGNITAAIENLLTRWVYTILTAKVVDLISISSDGKNDEMQLDEQMSLLQTKEATDVYDRFRKEAKPFLNNESVQQFLCELMEESRALYDRADLPAGDTPPFPTAPKKISYQALEELNKIQGVLAYGERFGTLNIFLDNDLKMEAKIEEDVRHVLQKWEINKVVFRYGSAFIEPYLKPGDKVFEEPFGSLAGFARQTDAGVQGGHLYALLSKHVAQRLNTNVLSINGRNVGQLLPTTEYTLDIAAAHIHEYLKNDCIFMFKTEQGETIASKLYDFKKDTKSISGKRVHLYGAMSSPGLGKISIEKLHGIFGNYHGVLFEDRKSSIGAKQPFCVPGDSGAMVLTYCRINNELKVLGMIIGKRIKDEAKTVALPGSPEKQAQACLVTESQSYLGFYMVDGLKDLQERHKIVLCLCCEQL